MRDPRAPANPVSPESWQFIGIISNPSMARFENMRANLKTHFKEPGSCLVPFSRTSSWNTHVIWSKIAYFQLLVFNEQTRQWKMLFLSVPDHVCLRSTELWKLLIEHLSGLAIIVLRKATISFLMSALVEQLGFNWQDFHEIRWEYFYKTFQENSGFITIWQELRLFYLKVNIHLWSHLAQFFSERELFRKQL